MIDPPDSQVDTPSHVPETEGGKDPGTPATTAATPATTAAGAGPEDDGISLDEAARRLKLSERSVRRLIKAGEIAAQKQASPRGDVWRVYLNSSTSGVTAEDTLQVSGNIGTDPGRHPGSRAATAAERATTAAGPNTDARGELSTSPISAAGPESRPEVLKALDVINELRRDNQQLARDNQMLAGQVGFLQAKLQDAEQRITRLLTATEEEDEDEEPEPVEPEPPAVPERVSWWRRLFS